MLKQYFQHKADHPGVLMAIRVGDFYEFYGEDAELAASALEITLTGREDGSNGRIPMAGVPYHAFEKYMARLVQAGFKVGICDQVEDPKQAKGLVRRAVTRVLTPGTLVEDSMLSEGQNNFLAAVCIADGRAGLATLDPSTGEFMVTEINGAKLMEQLLQEMARLRPTELLLDEVDQEVGDTIQKGFGVTVSQQARAKPERAAQDLMSQFGVTNLQGFGCEDRPAAVTAASMILSYARQNCLDLAHVETLSTYSVSSFVAMDPSTRRSLELTQNLADGSKKFTLLATLDKTVTAMGSRLIRRWIEQPLINADEIMERQLAVKRFTENHLDRGELRDVLKRIGDLERLLSRCSAGLASPRDLVAMATALGQVPMLHGALESFSFGRLATLAAQLGDHRELAQTLAGALHPDAPLTLRDGGVIRDGYDMELDKLRELSRDGKSYIAKLEATEREKTGISSLKVGFNSVFGYYLEVSKRDMERVPAEYIRKQTTANAERYITAELKEHESAVLGASEKAITLESELFHRLRKQVAAQAAAILQCARAIAEIDTLSAFAEVAVSRGFVQPEITQEDSLEIVAGRHPVVEEHGTHFVPNDVAFADPETTPEGMRLMILTGPNMSGKSTFLRQVAIIAVMAQIGSFVPAQSARIGISDAIFARIGAKDEIALGQSTFMVEMLESAYILNHSTRRSIVVLDEVGRGTSTFDGLAIAWAMIEKLAEIGAKTLFATHYHQLNVLAEQVPTIANYRVSVHESGDRIIWTHKVLAGGTDRSYGVHVARSAGMPPDVLRRASQILQDLENQPDSLRAISPQTQRVQLTLFEAEEPEFVRDLRSMDVYALTPMQALQLLEQWQTSLR